MVKPTFLEPEPQAPEVYRNTPFEYVVTAEPVHTVIKYGEPIPPVHSSMVKAGSIERLPRLPEWMTPPKSDD